MQAIGIVALLVGIQNFLVLECFMDSAENPIEIRIPGSSDCHCNHVFRIPKPFLIEFITASSYDRTTYSADPGSHTIKCEQRRLRRGLCEIMGCYCQRQRYCHNTFVAVYSWQMIPDFTAQGMSPPGIHTANLEEVRNKLGWGRKRRDLLDRLDAALRLMKHCGIVYVYLDGSFVTEKDRPGDIDGCYDVPSGVASLNLMFPIWSWTPSNRQMSKMMFGAELAPSRSHATASGEPYIEFFQKDDRGCPRGIVLLELTSEAL